MSKLSVKKGDKVLVVAGKDRGKKGKILAVFPKRERVTVERVALVKRHMRPTQKDPQGGIVEREGTVHASNVQLICPNCNQPTRVGYRETSKGVKVRVCRKCGEDADKA